MGKNIKVIFLYYFALLQCLSPVAFANCSYPDDPTLEAKRVACSTKPSLTWDCSKNRCLPNRDYKPTVTDDQRKACHEQQGKARAECYKHNARNAHRGHDNVDYTSEAWMSGGVGALASIALAFALGSSGSPSCAHRSYQVVMAAAGVLLLGELFTYYQFHSSSKKLHSKYKKRMDSDNSFSAQSEAFGFLEAEQKNHSKYLKNKSTVYFLASGLFAIAAVVAALEVAGVEKVQNSCAGDGESKSGDAATESKSKTDSGVTVEGAANAASAAASALQSGTRGEAPQEAASNPQSIQEASDVQVQEAGDVQAEEAADPANTQEASGSRTNPPAQPASPPPQAGPSSGIFKMLDEFLNSPKVIPSTQKTANNLMLFLEQKNLAEGKNQSPSLATYKKLKKEKVQKILQENSQSIDFALRFLNKFGNQFLIESAQAQKSGDLAVSLGLGGGTAATLLGLRYIADEWWDKTIGPFLRHGATRIVLTITMTGVTGFLGWYSLEKSKKAKENAKKIAKLKETFYREHDGLFDCRQKANQGRPQCFCYDEKGIIESRRNNVICANFLGAGAGGMEAGNYDVEPDPLTEKLCLDKRTNTMIRCEICRSTILEDGTNTCTTIDPTTFAGGVNTAGVGSSLAQDTNALLNSRATPGQLNNSNIGSNAIRAREAAFKAVDDVKPGVSQLANPNNPQTQKFLSKLRKSLPPKLRTGLGKNASLLSNVKAAVPGGLDDKARKKLNDLEKKANVDTSLNYRPINGPRNEERKSEYDDLFGGGNNQQFGNNTPQNISAEFADKDYDYKQNDINTREDIPLWKVISNRYIQSGLKKLFPDEEEPQSKN